MRTNSLLVNETFGPTFQGEGPSLGQRAIFLRLAGCNLACAFCDTPYTWDWTGRNGTVYSPKNEAHPTPIPDVAGDLIARGLGSHTRLLVVSGGEPMLQQDQIAALLRELWRRVPPDDFRVEVETNGTVLPKPEHSPRIPCVTYTVSPKCLALAQNTDRAQVPDGWRGFVFADRARFKFVCATEADVNAVNEWRTAYRLPNDAVWIMPLGVEQGDITRSMRAIADSTLRRGFHLTTRLHTLLWGNTRGK